MRLNSGMFERLPQMWVLVGLLIVATGLYIGFEHSLVFVYIGIGIMCSLYGLALFVVLLLDGPKKSNTRPLSRDFISAGSPVMMSASEADQEPTSSL
jgi:hypothetical protein